MHSYARLEQRRSRRLKVSEGWLFPFFGSHIIPHCGNAPMGSSCVFTFQHRKFPLQNLKFKSSSRSLLEGMATRDAFGRRQTVLARANPYWDRITESRIRLVGLSKRAISWNSISRNSVSMHRALCPPLRSIHCGLSSLPYTLPIHSGQSQQSSSIHEELERVLEGIKMLIETASCIFVFH